MSTKHLIPSAEASWQESTARIAPKTAEAVVLVGFSTAELAFARRAAGAGVRVHVVELAKEAGPYRRACPEVEAEGRTMAWERVGTPEGLEELHRFTEAVGADAVLSKDDYVLTWLGEHRGRFEPKCRVLTPDAAVLERLLDKSYQSDRAVAAGFELLPSWLLSSEEILRTIPGYLYPLVVRPSRPFSAHPTFKAGTIETQRELIELFGKTRWSWPPIVQPFCLGPNYVLHGMRSVKGEITALRLFQAYRKCRGFAASLREETLPARLEQAARRFVEREHLTGPFHFDLLRAEANGCFYFLEVNCRLGGTTARVMELGYDEAGLLLDAFGLRTPRPLEPLAARKRSASVKLNLQQALDAICNRRDPLAYPRLPRRKALMAALGEMAYASSLHWNGRALRFGLRLLPAWLRS